jgi:hypothetical protein
MLFGQNQGMGTSEELQMKDFECPDISARARERRQKKTRLHGLMQTAVSLRLNSRPASLQPY